mmetsp:Transcript_33567/g.62893  ORF Transcript_33567/g.62893 Transcript_33567/m.62893 type:complete len:156 (+) Transcript_33567:48-515(+)
MELPTPIVMEAGGSGLSTGRSLLSRVLAGSVLTSEALLGLSWTASEFARPLAALAGEPLADFQRSCPKEKSVTSGAKKVQFQEPIIIEVPSWKDETRQMYYRAHLDEDDILEESMKLLLRTAKRLLSSRVALAAASTAAMTGMVVVGMVSPMQLV